MMAKARRRVFLDIEATVEGCHPGLRSAGAVAVSESNPDVVYVGMFTRYIVELDSGGELTVVRQNLETSSQEALESRGRRVRLEWRPEHTFEIERGGQE